MNYLKKYPGPHKLECDAIIYNLMLMRIIRFWKRFSITKIHQASLAEEWLKMLTYKTTRVLRGKLNPNFCFQLCHLI